MLPSDSAQSHLADANPLPTIAGNALLAFTHSPLPAHLPAEDMQPGGMSVGPLPPAEKLAC